jgi:outer membrane protein assembly factor BamB
MATATDGFHGGLRAYPSSCFGTQHCAPLWSARAPGALNSPVPVVGAGKVFVFSNFGADFVEAFPAACGAGCQPIWRAFGVGNMASTPPSFSNGVLYVGSLTDGLKAFPADCSATCVPAWTWRGPGGVPAAIRTVVASPDRVFAGSADGNLYVFGPGTSRGPSTTTSNAIALAVYGGLALVLLAGVATRLRRRVSR